MGLMTGQHPSIPYPNASSMSAETLVAQPAGSPVYPLGFDGRLLGPPSSAYPPRLSMADLYGAAYPDPTAAAAAAASYMAGLAPGHPAAMLYPAALAGSPYDLKDPRTAWAALPQATGYPCDPALAAYGAYGDRFDPVDSEARRRNATRETTSTLKAWLNEHRKNPYPTKGEKIMLAIITKMTLTQVSTWFANARRRLKKENKMTWEPRNKTADDLDDVSIDDDDEDKKDDDHDLTDDSKSDSVAMENCKTSKDRVSPSSAVLEPHLNDKHRTKSPSPDRTSTSDPSTTPRKKGFTEIISSTEKRSGNSPIPSEKPKIWSLAQTATSASPPSTRRSLPPNLSPSADDLDSRMRVNRLVYHDRLSELNSASYHQRQRDIANELRSRALHNSSSESSLSSPPLWRTSEPVMSAFECGDLRSLSSSSSGSPAVVCSSFEGPHPSIASSNIYSHARFLGSRLLPGQDGILRLDIGNPSNLQLLHSERFRSQQSTMDLGPNHSSLIRPSFGSLNSLSSSQVVADSRR